MLLIIDNITAPCLIYFSQNYTSITVFHWFNNYCLYVNQELIYLLLHLNDCYNTNINDSVDLKKQNETNKGK